MIYLRHALMRTRAPAFPEQCDEDVDGDGEADNTPACDVDCSQDRARTTAG